jgi:hypothetical protein
VKSQQGLHITVTARGRLKAMGVTISALEYSNFVSIIIISSRNSNSSMV